MSEQINTSQSKNTEQYKPSPERVSQLRSIKTPLQAKYDTLYATWTDGSDIDLVAATIARKEALNDQTARFKALQGKAPAATHVLELVATIAGMDTPIEIKKPLAERNFDALATRQDNPLIDPLELMHGLADLETRLQGDPRKLPFDASSALAKVAADVRGDAYKVVLSEIYGERLESALTSSTYGSFEGWATTVLPLSIEQ